SIVSESMEQPEKYYRDILLTETLLDVMHQYDVRKLVFSSSAAVYGIPDVIPVMESAPLRPINPYGETKAAIEKMLYQQNWFQFVALRYFNACGAAADASLTENHDPETHLIPRLLQEPVWELYGTDYPTPDGTCIRDYVHVEDLAQAHLLALEHLLSQADDEPYGVSLNLGLGKGFSVREIMESVKRATGRTPVIKELPRRQGDPAILVADCRLAKDVLGWTPRYTDIDAILQTAIAARSF
ncbi:MAG: NAD-dependent epimerase/dehydratase family protein, partial [Bacillota bacterium]|nr:NAD-dependent epimerase/dehydratase family protein [Bacillota bacterium]